MVKKETQRNAKKQAKRIFESNKQSLIEVVDELSQSMAAALGIDNIDEYIDNWSKESGYDEMSIQGHRRIHDGTTFSMEAIQNMTDTMQLWLLCRILNRWNETGMSKRTAPLNLSLDVSVNFER